MPLSPEHGAQLEDSSSVTAAVADAVFKEDYVDFLEQQLRCLDDAPSSVNLAGTTMTSATQEQCRELAAELQRALQHNPLLVPSSMQNRCQRTHPLLSWESTDARSQASSCRARPWPALNPELLRELECQRTCRMSIDSTASTNDDSTPGFSCRSSLSEGSRDSLASFYRGGSAPGSAECVNPLSRLLSVVEADESGGKVTEKGIITKASGRKPAGHWLLSRPSAAKSEAAPTPHRTPLA